ncbi:MAG: RNA polymerase sigma-70 factor [Chitinophagaceae bacterium]|nr:RNA polymerase sigma-70 factor [Chitinophagaceae bacterium]
MRKPSVDIQDLLIRIGERDDMTAYEKFYYHFYTPLFNFALSIVDSRQQAEEIVSDVFVKIWRSRKTLLKINNISTYLYTCVRNGAIDYLNRMRKHEIIHFSPTDYKDVFIELRNPSDHCISTDLMKKINDAINQLPSQCKVIFKLVKEDGLSYKQVAEIMHLSPLTVRNQLAIAIRRMGEILPEHIYNDSGSGKREKV